MRAAQRLQTGQQARILPDMPRDVARAFDTFEDPVRPKLLALRRLIFETAVKTDGVGPLTEALRWGEPAYLTTKTKAGSTIRLGGVRGAPDQFAMYFNCNTNLVGTFRREFAGHFSFEGNRAICFHAKDRLPKAVLAQCIAMALTYHRNK